MPQFIVVQTIALSEETRLAWKEQGGVILKMERTLNEGLRMALNGGYDFVINCGSRDSTNVELPRPDYLWNAAGLITQFNYPGALRQRLPELAVPRPESFPATVWLKAPGHAGLGKTQIITNGELILPQSWDWQQHIDGEEFRVITVGPRAVQGFRREGANGARAYQWTGLESTPTEVLSLARRAAKEIGGPTIVAWDLIRSSTTGAVYLLEGNSSPGISTPTADRVIREIARQREENLHAV